MLLRIQSLKATLLALMIVSTIIPRLANAGDWKVHEADMATFQAKMGSLQKEIQELVERRKGTEAAEDAKKINEEIVKKYADLKQTNDDYDAEKLHMRFQHPEKGDLAERKYPRVKLRSLTDLEDDLSLDGQLDRMRNKLSIVYGIAPIHKGGSEESADGSRSPASVTTEAEQRIILKK